MEKTYEIVAGAPPAMPWNDYVDRVMDEWRALLSSDDASKEKGVQAFLEQHPSLVPGAFGSIGLSGSGHGPFPGAVIAQPPLHGLGTRTPDFMWIACDSARLSPILVEIENPTKRWFRHDGVPSEKLTQALNQISDWKAWFREPTNQQLFREFYGIPDDLWRSRDFAPKYILVYGSRQEFEGHDDLNKKRPLQEREDELHMTCDRLQPEPKARDLLCVSITKPRSYLAVSWPAPTRVHPSDAEDLRLIKGKEAAVAANPWISSERRTFLLNRLPYWDEWARIGRKGIISSGDFE